MSKTSNADILSKAFEDKSRQIQKLLQQGMTIGGLNFIGKIQREQMTGRPGLMVKSNFLRGGWFAHTTNTGADIITKMICRAWYAKVHQHLDFNGWIYPKKCKFLRFPVPMTEYSYYVKGKNSGQVKVKQKSMFVFAKKVFIPKRLNIFEEFARSGADIFKRAILAKIKPVLALK
jgi:hypothetical protein